MQKISVNLWFDNQAEAAVKFYTSTFGNSKITGTMRYGEAGTEIHGGKPGSVMLVEFELDGFSFTALNGGPQFKPNPSVSFFVNCGSADEVDAVWARFSEGGSVLMPLDEYPFSRKYGWVEDRFGVSWQVNLAETEPRQRFIPSLLFVGERCGKAEEAIGFYTSVFRNAKRGSLFPYGADQQTERKGTVMYADFELEGQRFAAMDSSIDHSFDFNEAVSFIINCTEQSEIDYYWSRLSAVPEAEGCGWLKDRYGVSWQIVPTKLLTELMGDGDAKQADRVMDALLQMKKLDIDELRRAAGPA